MFSFRLNHASFLRRTMMFVILVILLASVFMFTYSGRVESGDSLMYFDATGSLVRFGDLFLDLTLWFNPPGVDKFEYPYPLGIINPESWDPILQPHLAYGLYWLADQLPGLGLVHTVWQGTCIHTVHPDVDLKEFGVDYTQADKEGLLAAYRHGQTKGEDFLKHWPG